jgi:hypothetical protein
MVMFCVYGVFHVVHLFVACPSHLQDTSVESTQPTQKPQIYLVVELLPTVVRKPLGYLKEHWGA